VFYLIVIDMY